MKPAAGGGRRGGRLQVNPSASASWTAAAGTGAGAGQTTGAWTTGGVTGTARGESRYSITRGAAAGACYELTDYCVSDLNGQFRIDATLGGKVRGSVTGRFVF